MIILREKPTGIPTESGVTYIDPKIDGDNFYSSSYGLLRARAAEKLESRSKSNLKMKATIEAIRSKDLLGLSKKIQSYCI